jgi:hypothetical protein
VEARIFRVEGSGDGILKVGKKLGIGTSVMQRVSSKSRGQLERIN